MLLMVHIAMGVVAFVVMFSPTTAHYQIEEMLQKALMNYKDDDKAADYINKIQTMVSIAESYILKYDCMYIFYIYSSENMIFVS